MNDRPWSSAGPAGEFQPYVPGSQSPTEFSLRAVLLGSLFGLLFGAVTVYVGLRAGLTVSASIPISVLSISILRAFGRSTILENNIVQTTGSAGESLAAGVMIPCLGWHWIGPYVQPLFFCTAAPSAKCSWAGTTCSTTRIATP